MKSSPLLKERLLWAGLACIAAIAGATGALWSTSHGSHPTMKHMAGHDHGGPKDADIQRVLAVNQGKPILPSCRQGAFVEASNMINTIVQIHNSLPSSTPALVYADLDSLLYTNLKQAKSEVHCIAGGLSHGYDKSFAVSIQRGMQMAQNRKLPPEVVAMGQSVVDALHANKPMATAN